MMSSRKSIQRGGIPFLGILILIGIGFLAVGSYFQYQERQALAPSPTPTPYVVNVDKSKPIQGQILVVFKNSTPTDEISSIFTKANVYEFSQVSDNSFLIYKATVPKGSEVDYIDQLKSSDRVVSATLSYE